MSTLWYSAAHVTIACETLPVVVIDREPLSGFESEGHITEIKHSSIGLEKNIQRKIVNIFLPINFNIYFWVLKRTVSLSTHNI